MEVLFICLCFDCVSRHFIYCQIASCIFRIHSKYLLDISKDEIKAAKIAHHYTKFNLLYKNLKTNQNPKFFYCKNSSVGISPNDTICRNKL